MVRTGTLLSLLAGSTAFAQAKIDLKPAHVRGGYIVELESAENAASLSSQIDTKGDIRVTFDSPFFRGASVQFRDLETAEADAQSLASAPGIKQIWPITMISRPKDEVIWVGDRPELMQKVKRQLGNDTFSPHVMTQVDKLQAEGYTGKGIKVAVIDTGIDYTHPALGGKFGPGNLVSFGWDFTGDAYTGFNAPQPDSDPYDGCAGHGTHVAGTIAAQTNNLGFTGAAPGVTLGAYRVFGCDGGSANDILIEAYLRAAKEGSNIITASLGDFSGWSQDAVAVVVSRIVQSGIPCTVSAGNEGDKGLFFASAPANGVKVTAIASFDNVVSPSLLLTSYATVGGGPRTEFGYALGTPGNWNGVKLPLWAPALDVNDPAAEGCNPYPAGTPDLSGHIVLVRRGTCTFAQKATNAAASGAKYIMYYNNVAGAGAVSLDVSKIGAAGMVTPEQGAAWVKALAAKSEIVLDFLDPLKAPITLKQMPNTQMGGFASSFTTWGPTFEGDIKPQLAAPGGQILSTYPVALGSYAVLSGTSMSCPLAAGIVALVAEARGTLDPELIENVLSATSKPQLFYDGQAKTGRLAPVAQQGAGMIQAWHAAHAVTVLSTSGIAFNDTDHLVASKSFTIKNTGNSSVTYRLGSVGAATAYTFLNTTMPAAYPGLATDGSFATISLSRTNVTIAPRSEATIQVKVDPPSIKASRLPVYSGYITLNATNGENLSLPYQGIVGSLHNTTVLGRVYLTLSTDKDARPIVGGNSSFAVPLSTGNLTGVPLPDSARVMTFGSPLVKVEAVRLDGGYASSRNGTAGAAKSLGNIAGYPLPWASRQPTRDIWNGSMADGTYAPAGRYKLVVSALRVFGDAAVDSEYDVKETVPFSIRYT